VDVFRNEQISLFFHSIMLREKPVGPAGAQMIRMLRSALGLSILLLLALIAPSFLVAQDSAGQDLKNAGHETKEAAKDTGRATKRVAKKTGRATKKGTQKAAEKTEGAARKVKNKTDPD
jgi:hypothetical protein